MSEVKLNLARKWRSRNFNEIVGQDLCVRMLKNSLYLQQFFPVYLFSGQRGCGKTSTARVFAMALNCHELSAFQKSPQKVTIPCMHCASCVAMIAHKHPDFIEIDAASHTGVDNVRSLIDSASLLPVMGCKKIYLIDEAHMLSKAAFNAFLKILEEPPRGVLFILATTDPQKIIDTVRSRCFQLFFNPIDAAILQDRLRTICDAERISYDAAGLGMIVKQTEGCVRDAINLLEQVRFSSSSVTCSAVLQVLGHLDDGKLIVLFENALFGNPRDLLHAIKDLKWDQFSAQVMWTRLLELARAALWIKYRVEPQHFGDHYEKLSALVARCTPQQLHAVLETMNQYESLFTRTTAKHDVLEMVLLHICYHHGTDTEGNASPSSAQASTAPVESSVISSQDEQEDQDDEQNDSEEDDASARWKTFVESLQEINDPLVTSIFTQGIISRFDKAQGTLEVVFSKEFVFFSDRISHTEPVWKPLFVRAFGQTAKLIPSFTGAAPSVAKVSDLRVSVAAPRSLPVTAGSAAQSTRPAQQPATKYSAQRAPFRRTTTYSPFVSESAIDVSDAALWPRTHMMLRHIPGTITQLPDEASVL